VSASVFFDKWNSVSGRERRELIGRCVEYVLSSFPGSRNSDLYLTILALRYCTPMGKYISIVPYELIREFDGILEAIRRTRQLFNERGLYLPTDQRIYEKRLKKARRFKRAVVTS